MKWTENTALATLVIAENAVEQLTTYERLCYHLVHEHGLPAEFITQRSQQELEGVHNRDHDTKGRKPITHKHAHPIRICGYEPKGDNRGGVDTAEKDAGGSDSRQ